MLLMRYFQELDNEKQEIMKKVTKLKRVTKWVKVLIVVMFLLLGILFWFSSYNIQKWMLFQQIIKITLLINFVLLGIFAYLLDKNSLTLRQDFLSQIDWLRNFLHKKETTQYLEILKDKTAFLETKYNLHRMKVYGFNIEKKIDNFLKNLLLHLKYYSKKNYLNFEDIIELGTFFDIVLEGLLNEKFTLEGLPLKKPPKKVDLPQLINKVKGFLKSEWVKIMILFIISFFILFVCKMFGWITEISFTYYVLCASLVIIIYSIFFKGNPS